MTNVYFVRHATPNYDNHDDLARELTAQGLKDRKQVTSFYPIKISTSFFRVLTKDLSIL